MDKQYFVKEAKRAIENLHTEFYGWCGQVELVTHILNLEYWIGRYHSYLEILIDNRNFDDSRQLQKENIGFIEAVYKHIDRQYAKLKEV